MTAKTRRDAVGNRAQYEPGKSEVEILPTLVGSQAAAKPASRLSAPRNAQETE